MRPTIWALLPFAAALAASGLEACSSSSSHPPDIGDCTASSIPCSTPTVGGATSAMNDAATSSGCGVDVSASQCDQCANASCCTPLANCFASSACVNLLNCEDSCSSSACVTACDSQFPTGAATLAELASCEATECKVCSESGVGDPCSAQDDPCNPGLVCPGSWCTKACTATSDCVGLGAGGGNGLNQANACIQTPASGRICVPGCASDADCAVFPGTYCLETTSVAAESVLVCAPLPDAGSE